MGEISASHHRRPPPPPATRPSRLAVRGGMGEIVEVEGGHIVRSTGRKDRHSKVCTAKGPRDRRVRLAAHTAIQFYDVQDRLGYDRPSKAVDWLIKNAKSAIDDLAKLPAWNPNNHNPHEEHEKEREQNQIVDVDEKEIPIGVVERFGEIEVEIENPNRGGRLDFLAPNFDDSDTIIADSIKSFFPIGVPETNSPPSIQFQSNYSPDLISRNSSNSSVCQNNQDLRLSLQSLQQDHILLHQPQNEELFPATTSVEFHGASFPDDHDRFHRMIAWNSGNATNTGDNCHGGGGGGGFIFNSPSPSPVPALSQCFSSQRGPLQSSNSPLLRAWIDSSIAAVTPDHQHQYLPPTFHNQSLIYGGGGGGGFDSGVFSGFRIPARIQGEEEYDGVSDKPSSASSDSRH